MTTTDARERFIRELEQITAKHGASEILEDDGFETFARMLARSANWRAKGEAAEEAAKAAREAVREFELEEAPMVARAWLAAKAAREAAAKDSR